MHRVITKCKSGEDIDHRNHDGLDNRRLNLRVCSRSQNLQNQRRRSNNTSGFKGVAWCEQTQDWTTAVKVNKKLIWLGHYADKEEAAHAYDAAAREHFGEFACLNFP